VQQRRHERARLRHVRARGAAEQAAVGGQQLAGDLEEILPARRRQPHAHRHRRAAPRREQQRRAGAVRRRAGREREVLRPAAERVGRGGGVGEQAGGRGVGVVRQRHERDSG
jgi:hypothetical protein